MHGDRSSAYREAGDLVGRYGRAAAGEPDGRAGQVGEDMAGAGAVGGLLRGRVRGGYADGPRGRPVLGDPRLALLGLRLRGMGGQPPLDGDPGRGRVGVLQPLAGGLRGRVLAHEELDGVAVPQDRAQRRQAAVHPGSDAGVRVLAVLRVRGVHAARPLGQAKGAAVGPEDGDLAVLGEVLAQGRPEVVGVGCRLLPVEEPGEPAGAGGVDALAVGRVLGGGRVGVAEGDDTGLGDLVHLVRADQDLDDLAVLARHGRAATGTG